MQRKTKRLEIRLTQEQKTRFQQAAEARAESLTQFILRMSETGAHQVLDDTEKPPEFPGILAASSYGALER